MDARVIASPTLRVMYPRRTVITPIIVASSVEEVYLPYGYFKQVEQGTPQAFSVLSSPLEYI